LSDLRENFGIVTAEALALGRPVIVCRGLEWDDIEAREGGGMFDRHPDAAAGAIRRAAETKRETWIHMAEKAKLYSEQRLDIRATAEQVWAAVTGCVDHK